MLRRFLTIFAVVVFLLVGIATAYALLIKATLKAQVQLPDLIVRDIKLIKDCKIQITIMNIGNAKIPESGYDLKNGAAVQMYKENTPWGGIRLGAIDPTRKLNTPGASITHVWFPKAINLNLTPGWHSIKLIVDNNNAVRELKEDNNSLTKRLKCEKPIERLPDLTVTDIAMSPTSPTTSDLIQFKAVIKNIGVVAAAPSKAAFKVGGETYPKIYSIPQLNPGANYVIQRSARLDVAQNYRVTATADSKNDVVESDEGNNEKYIQFRVTAPPPLQVTFPVTSQDFEPKNNKLTLTIRFNKAVLQSSVVPRSSFIVNTPKDSNASGTILWISDHELIWTSTKDYNDLCKWTPDCNFSLTITDSVKDSTGQKLDGDKNGTPGGNFTHVYTHIG